MVTLNYLNTTMKVAQLLALRCQYVAPWKHTAHQQLHLYLSDCRIWGGEGGCLQVNKNVVQFTINLCLRGLSEC